MRRRVASGLHRLRTDTRLLASFLVIAILALAGLKLGSEMLEGETLAWDGAILRWLRAATQGQSGFETCLRHTMLDLTALGGTTVLTLVMLLAVGYLATGRKGRLALVLVLAVLAGIGTSFALKAYFQRLRPDIVDHLVAVQTASFPSGHAMNSAIVYLTLGALLARAERARGRRRFIIGCALTLTLLIGLSRLYLGVHWPTDVLAGWIFGAGWATATSLIVDGLQGRHAVEQPGQ